MGLICAPARVLKVCASKVANSPPAARDEKKKYDSAENRKKYHGAEAFLFFFYILQIPTRGEHPADEHADDTTKGDASGEHGAEERALFALLRGVSFSFFFARAV